MTSPSATSWTALVHKRSSIDVQDACTTPNNKLSTSTSTSSERRTCKRIVVLSKAPLQQESSRISTTINGLVVEGLQVVGINGKSVVGQSAREISMMFDAWFTFLDNNSNVDNGNDEPSSRRCPIRLRLHGIVALGSPSRGSIGNIFASRRQALGIAFFASPVLLRQDENDTTQEEKVHGQDEDDLAKESNGLNNKNCENNTKKGMVVGHQVSISRIHPRGVFSPRGPQHRRLRPGYLVTNIQGRLVSTMDDVPGSITVDTKDLIDRLASSSCPRVVAIDTSDDVQHELHKLASSNDGQHDDDDDDDDAVITSKSSRRPQKQSTTPASEVSSMLTSSSGGGFTRSNSPAPSVSSSTTRSSAPKGNRRRRHRRDSLVLRPSTNMNAKNKISSTDTSKKTPSTATTRWPTKEQHRESSSTIVPTRRGCPSTPPLLVTANNSGAKTKKSSGAAAKPKGSTAFVSAAVKKRTAASKERKISRAPPPVFYPFDEKKIITITLPNKTSTDARIGLFLRHENLGSRAVIVQHVLANGLFASTKLQAGHRLVRISETPCPSSLPAVVSLLQTSTGTLTLQVVPHVEPERLPRPV